MSVTNPVNLKHFEIVQSGTISSSNITPVSVTTAANQYATVGPTDNFPHNLGYIPAVIAYNVIAQEGHSLLPFTLSDGSGTQAYWYTLSVLVDETNIQVFQQATAYNYPTGISFGLFGDIRYYLLRETAN